ncbi:MAG TPA: succinylglutamate desuccinylase/aspartoacylase family protein [Saprospiraceae bacterium]|nr:succinylglutamate desuccinylase/aspartoacylase family protein [Saprospiraceae bacterium]
MLDRSLYNEARTLRLGKNEILPGHNIKVNYNVGHLPSGTRVSIQMEIFRSESPGPHVLLIGGVHGDEINGVELMRRALEQNLFRYLLKGSVIVIPLLNVYGFINFSRDVPDGKDVNRSFPGATGGSLASRVARIITKNLMPQIDLIIDCHTGSRQLFNYPQVRVTKGDEISLEIARVFNPPFIFQRTALRGSLRKAARQANKLCLTYEGGEALRLDGYALSRGLSGIQRVLHAMEMVDESIMASDKPIELESASWLRASDSGLFIWSKNSGKRITKGEPLGVIADPYGTKKTTVLAPRDGFIIGHMNAPVVNKGDALFHIGY